MVRTPQSQTKHDRKVMSLAREYYRKGYEVWADVPGWSLPQSIGGYRPDIIAVKNGHTTVVEVETHDSVNSTRDIAQQRAFRSWAARKSTRHYRRVVV
jgi:hypothetical protein